MSAKLGEILVRENLISPQHLRQALDYQREHGGRLGFNLVKLGLVSDDTITAVLSRQYGIPSVNLELFDIDDLYNRCAQFVERKEFAIDSLECYRSGGIVSLLHIPHIHQSF